jgi:hypothetical protein
MMPYDNYRLYQIERAKSPAEVRRADEQAARLASAASSLFRGLTRPWRVMRRPSPAATRDLPRPADCPACADGKPTKAPGTALCLAYRKTMSEFPGRNHGHRVSWRLSRVPGSSRYPFTRKYGNTARQAGRPPSAICSHFIPGCPAQAVAGTR